MSAGGKILAAAVVVIGVAIYQFAIGELADKKPVEQPTEQPVEQPIAKPVEGTRGFIDEINRPPEPYTGPPRTGVQVYAYRCAGCHDRTTQGAPMPGDDIEWGLRSEQGMDVLMQHVIEGFNEELMPPRGSCGNCTDAELKATVIYMLEVSGIEPPPP